jgi:hypothetical protein
MRKEQKEQRGAARHRRLKKPQQQKQQPQLPSTNTTTGNLKHTHSSNVFFSLLFPVSIDCVLLMRHEQTFSRLSRPPFNKGTMDLKLKKQRKTKEGDSLTI